MDLIAEAIRLDGGMVEEEIIAFCNIASEFKEDKVITNVGCYRGSSCIIMMEALRGKKAKFNFIDCFDIPGISAMSDQGCLDVREFMTYITPWIDQENHEVKIIRANTLEMLSFPKSDYFFLDAGHTKECITNDIKLAKEAWSGDGMLIFHDYKQPIWPDVTTVIDSNYDITETYRTLAVYRGN